MLNRIYIIVIALVSVISFNSCKDECEAGTGGNVSFVFKPVHHSNAIKGAVIKIKFSAQEFPGENGAYDLIYAAGADEESVSVSGMKCGDYYFWCTGIDSSLSTPDKTVKGGIPYTTDKENGTIEVFIPVNEAGH